jgi:hypothetical protein
LSFSNGYDTDMRVSSASDRILEAALAGGKPSGSDTDVVADLVDCLRNEVDLMGSPPDSEAHIMAAAAAAVRATGSSAVASSGFAMRPRSLRTRLAVVMASMMALLLATAGVGLAADDAMPGDPLYGLDRALENFGVGNGMAEERLTEAAGLFESGQVGLALGHAAVTVATLPEQAEGKTAKEALDDAAELLDSNGHAPAKVGELLRYLADNYGAGNGEGVVAIAKQIRDEVAQGSAPDVPPGPPTSTPGPPGPPVTPGG